MTDSISGTQSDGSHQSPDWEAIARELTGESLPGDSARVTPADREMLASMERILSTVSAPPADIDVEAALATVKARPDFRARDVIPLRVDRKAEPGRRTRWIVPMPAIAAAAVLAVGVASWMAYNNRLAAGSVAAVTGMHGTGVGIRDSLTLSDGTRIVLGPLSSVTIPDDFGKESRSIEIHGDAWFDVIHDEGKPFTVRAGNAAIVDVGTVFTVSSDNSGGVSVSVTEGAVSLRQVNTPASQGVILKAGDKGHLELDGRVMSERGAVTSDDIAWRDGHLVFREATLADVAGSLRKWYGIEMKIADQSLGDRHLTATFSGESPERVLETIELALGAEIERRGDTAVVR
ncbi:MAG TPA: FecR domain-containing protein, partial [Gemmatimonadaceae bacterium]